MQKKETVVDSRVFQLCVRECIESCSCSCHITIDIRNSFGTVAANFNYSEAGNASENDKYKY